VISRDKRYSKKSVLKLRVFSGQTHDELQSMRPRCRSPMAESSCVVSQTPSCPDSVGLSHISTVLSPSTCSSISALPLQLILHTVSRQCEHDRRRTVGESSPPAHHTTANTQQLWRQNFCSRRTSPVELSSSPAA